MGGIPCVYNGGTTGLGVADPTEGPCVDHPTISTGVTEYDGISSEPDANEVPAVRMTTKYVWNIPPAVDYMKPVVLVVALTGNVWNARVPPIDVLFFNLPR